MVLCFHLSAEDLITESEVAVTTKITTVGELLSAPSSPVKQELTSTLEDPPPQTSCSDDSIVIEGWQKSWEDPPPHTQAMYTPNIHWLKNDPNYGMFTREALLTKDS